MAMVLTAWDLMRPLGVEESTVDVTVDGLGKGCLHHDPRVRGLLRGRRPCV
jgi:hypothetical protein